MKAEEKESSDFNIDMATTNTQTHRMIVHELHSTYA